MTMPGAMNIFVSSILLVIPRLSDAFSTLDILQKSPFFPQPIEHHRFAKCTNVRYVKRYPSLPNARIRKSSVVNSSPQQTEEEFHPENPLRSAGLSFISASTKSLGMLFYNIGGMDHKEIQALLLQAGTHLLSAGNTWDDDWDSVRESMFAASHAFYDISNVFGSANIDESLPLAMLFEKIGNELEDVSNISGCCAVGPPSACPNLLAVEEHLVEISKILKLNSVAATDEHMMCTLFKEVAELFGEMAGRYVDTDRSGQESEVSV
mmetsp:Transcript_583/g.1209  ORF Transcript_583/g.1209 Transcript_583/m.1209 type:complete len:265 (-) Transcript_583:1636-2430(-)